MEAELEMIKQRTGGKQTKQRSAEANREGCLGRKDFARPVRKVEALRAGLSIFKISVSQVGAGRGILRG